MNQKFLIIFLMTISIGLNAQSTAKKRLDFAKSYFELGGTFLPSFQGKTWSGNELVTSNNPNSVVQYLNWGGLHFWGHGEFYVTIPLGHFSFEEDKEASFELLHSVATGFRFFPIAYEEKKIRPYLGLAWSAMDFKQILDQELESPILSKDFLWTYDIGVLYGFRNFSFRLGVNYFSDNKWTYPVSKTSTEEIKTPNYGIQLGLLYLMDFTKETDQENIDNWNNYPIFSKQSSDATNFGNFFIGIGPSISYSLKVSSFNQEAVPFLKNQLTSTNYFDIAAGYHFEKWGLFTALSFRNPKFETEGFGVKQTIKKYSLSFEINKFLLDYSGFAPYIGAVMAYDRFKYEDNIDGLSRNLTFENKFEPGIVIGWDIAPGKTSEALILRTNLRWFPKSSFLIDNKKFDFSQLEYNLIQVIFYPGRWKKR